MRAFDGLGLRDRNKPSKRIPKTLQEFIALANTVAPLLRPGFLLGGDRELWGGDRKLSLADVYDWLCETSWGILLPKRIEVDGLLQDMHTVGPLVALRKSPFFSPEEPPEPAVIVLAWSNALCFVIQKLLAIIAVREEPFDARNLGYKPIPWDQPWMSQTLEIGLNKTLFFSRRESPLAQLYENFRRALDGADASRIKICHAELRHDLECGRFYWARVHKQKACSPKHAQLMRAKRWLKTDKGRKYYARQLRKE